MDFVGQTTMGRLTQGEVRITQDIDVWCLDERGGDGRRYRAEFWMSRYDRVNQPTPAATTRLFLAKLTNARTALTEVMPSR